VQIIFLLPFLALFLWLYAEARLGKTARVITGTICITFTGFACHFFAKIIPRYESTAHRSSLRLAGELTANGETQQVQQAIQAYNRVADSGSTYSASMEMWRVLNQGRDSGSR